MTIRKLYYAHCRLNFGKLLSKGALIQLGILGVLFCTEVRAQTFSNRYDLFDTTFFETRSVVADDQGITVLGTQLDSGYDNRLWFIRISDNGDLEFAYPHAIEFREHYAGWQNSFNRANDGYVLGGASSLINEGGNVEAEITKFDLNGNLVWRSQFGDSLHNDQMFVAIPAIDGGVISIGQTNGVVPGSADILVIKTDEDGALDWTNSWGSPTQWEIYANIDTYGNEHYLIGGFKDITPLNPQGYLKKIDLEGNEVQSVFHSIEGEVIMSYERFEVLEDLSVIAAVETTDPDDSNEDTSYIVKLNSNLQIDWYVEVQEDFNYNFGVANIALTPDGLVYSGITNDIGSQSLRQGYFAKIDELGNQLWYRNYTYVDNGINVLFGLDNIGEGFVAAGMTLFVPGDEPESELGEQDLWLIKVDSLGCLVPGCHVGITDLVDNTIGFKAYPNPCANDLSIYFDDLLQQKGSYFRITNMQGALVTQFEASVYGNTYVYDVSGLANGLYHLSLLTNGRPVQTETIVVNR